MSLPGFLPDIPPHRPTFTVRTEQAPAADGGQIVAAASTWTSEECIGYRSQTVCGVPYPNMSTCISACSGGFCQPHQGAYACCRQQEVCTGTTTCTHYDGDCTGTKLFFWQPAPTRCVTGQSGMSRCVSGWNQYPWVRECGNGSRTSGVGFCLW